MTRPATRARWVTDDLPVRADATTVERLRLGRLIAGSVTVDRQNRLQYRVGTAGREETFRLDGTWGLTPAHELALTLHEAGEDARRTLYLKGALVEARQQALVVALDRREEADAASQRLTLTGRWTVDARNRLAFLVTKADGREDRLILQSGWELGAHHALVYRYQRRATASTPAREHTIGFEGAWDITGADRLVYRLAGSSDAALEFRASVQSPSLLARDGRLVYEVGLELARGRSERRRVTLFGAWKVNRDLSVSFEVPYADGRIQAIRFAGSFALGPRNRIVVALSSREGEALGLTVVFTRELFPDARLFLRLQQTAEERAVIGGVQVRF